MAQWFHFADGEVGEVGDSPQEKLSLCAGGEDGRIWADRWEDPGRSIGGRAISMSSGWLTHPLRLAIRLELPMISHTCNT